MSTTATRPVLTVTDDVTVQIEGKRTFSRCTFGTVAGYRDRYNDPIDPADIDYPWLNADCMVIDGRAKPAVPMVRYGDVVTIAGYGDFAIEPPARIAGGDSPTLRPVNREITREQDDALMTLSIEGEVRARMTGARPYGQPMDDGDVVIDAHLDRGAGVPPNQRYSRVHVMPNGRVRTVRSHTGGRDYYAD